MVLYGSLSCGPICTKRFSARCWCNSRGVFEPRPCGETIFHKAGLKQVLGHDDCHIPPPPVLIPSVCLVLTSLFAPERFPLNCEAPEPGRMTTISSFPRAPSFLLTFAALFILRRALADAFWNAVEGFCVHTVTTLAQLHWYFSCTLSHRGAVTSSLEVCGNRYARKNSSFFSERWPTPRA